ncbi:MAG: hypothetical protein U1F21_07070 [Sphaerotilus natans]
MLPAPVRPWLRLAKLQRQSHRPAPQQPRPRGSGASGRPPWQRIALLARQHGALLIIELTRLLFVGAHCTGGAC